MKRVAAGSAFAMVAFALAGCGGDADATASADCLPVPPEVPTAIADGAPEGSRFVAQQASAVLGTGGEVYFVAMRFEALGQKDMAGVWSTTSIVANEAASVMTMPAIITSESG